MVAAMDKESGYVSELIEMYHVYNDYLKKY